MTIIGAALVRPFAEIVPAYYHILTAASGALWICAFTLFCLEYGPMLVRNRRSPRGAA